MAPVAVEAFRRHLRHLTRRYRLVPASALPEAVSARRRWGRIPVAVTFDDDLPCHVEHAAPALEEAGAPATFFLTGAGLEDPGGFWWQLLQEAWDRGLVDGRVIEAWDAAPAGREPTIRDVAAAVQAMEPARRDAATATLREVLPTDRGPRLLDTDGVGALASRGFEIGFHTRRHDDLLGLDAGALPTALVAGRDELERAAGRPVEVISYPHGRANATVAAHAAGAGFLAAYVADGRAVSPRSDRHLLGRRYPARGSIAAFSLDIVRALAAAR
jgi:peptidoglycan/xylan/chitin deacetylase (PgdA/CDA1 family)